MTHFDRFTEYVIIKSTPEHKCIIPKLPIEIHPATANIYTCSDSTKAKELLIDQFRQDSRFKTGDKLFDFDRKTLLYTKE
ncbi:MAG: hypothetical protein R3B45_15335 [Bdellovibrionota bacterium]